jgi:hypothetical protein
LAVASLVVATALAIVALRLAPGLITTVPGAGCTPFHASRGGSTLVVSPPRAGIWLVAKSPPAGSAARRRPRAAFSLCSSLARWSVSDWPGASMARPPIWPLGCGGIGWVSAGAAGGRWAGTTE